MSGVPPHGTTHEPGASDPAPQTLASLTDVSVSNIQQYSLLQWNGTQWVNVRYVGESQIQNDNTGALVSAINADTTTLNIQPSKVASACPPGFIYIGSPTGLTQTAIDNAYTSANNYSGICLDAAVIYQTTGGLIFPYSGLTSSSTPKPFGLIATMKGGSAYADKNAVPGGYVSVASSGTWAGGGTSSQDGLIVPDYAGAVAIQGIAVCMDGASNSVAALHVKGARNTVVRDCYVRNSPYSGSAPSAGWGLLLNAPAGGNGVNAEDNYFETSYVRGWRAISIGENDGTQQANDTLWNQMTTHGTDSGVYVKEGGNHTFLNWYDRSNPSTAAFNMAGGEATLIGGEDQNSSGNNIAASGGQLWLKRRALTAAGGPGVSITGGTVWMDGCRQNQQVTITISSGNLIVERTCYFNGATLQRNGGHVWYPLIWPANGTDTGAAWSTSGTGGTSKGY